MYTLKLQKYTDMVNTKYMCSEYNTMSEQTDWDTVSFVQSSEYRTTTLKELQRKPQMPAEIAEETDVEIAHISRALGDLRERDLVELLVSEETKKGRIYDITESGVDILETIENR